MQELEQKTRPIHLYGLTSLEGRLRHAFNLNNSSAHIKAVREILTEQMASIRESNQHRGAGASTVKFITDLVDTLIRILLDNLEVKLLPTDKLIALVAVGGYGKMELCPKSDIDLLILTSEKISKSETEQAESIVRALWDYGFDVGSSVRSVSQCETVINKDSETYTSFLSERFLGGNWNLYRDFTRAVFKPLMPWKTNALIQQKIEERNRRLDKFGGLIQHLEPNIKEGIGSLRDVHTIQWIIQIKYGATRVDDMVRQGIISIQDYTDLRMGYNYLLQARCCLHYVKNKKDDLLNFHIQPEIAKEFGFREEENRKPVELFLQYFYHHTKAINRVTESFLSRWQPVPKSKSRGLIQKHPHFVELNGTLEFKVAVGNPFKDNPNLMLEYFDLVNKTGLSYGSLALHRMKQTIRTIEPGEVDQKTLLRPFLKLCRRPERVGRMLRTMHDVGLISYIIPDFQIVGSHVQHNIYHIYTTDEHTLSVVRQLAYLPKSKEEHLESLRQAYEAISDFDVMILVCIFHDIGKGIPGDHSVTGAEMIYKYMLKMDYTESQAMEGHDLVLHHLAMNEIAQRRNIEDPQVIQDLISKVKSPSTLHKLYVLTYCDTSSVHPDAWSVWKSTLLRSLYHRTLDEFKRPLNQYIRAAEAQDQLIEAASKLVDRKLVFEHVKKMPKEYSTMVTPEQVADHVQMLKSLKDRKLVLHRKETPTHQNFSLLAPDNPQLLLAIFCATSQLNLTVLSSRIFTRMDGVVLLEFSAKYAFSNPPDWAEIDKKLPEQIVKNIKASIDQLYNNYLNLKQPPELMQKKGVHVRVGVDFSNKISASYSTIDISCPDKLGLMFIVLKVFHDLDIIVHGAILTTEAGAALDSFYVRNMNNRKLNNSAKILQLQSMLEKELLGENQETSKLIEM